MLARTMPNLGHQDFTHLRLDGILSARPLQKSRVPQALLLNRPEIQTPRSVITIGPNTPYIARRGNRPAGHTHVVCCCARRLRLISKDIATPHDMTMPPVTPNTAPSLYTIIA